MTHIAGIDIPATPQVAVPAYLAAVTVVALLAGRAADVLTRRWMGDTLRSQIERRAVPALVWPVTVALACGGLLAALPALSLSADARHILDGAIAVVLVASCGLALSRLGVAVVTHHAERTPSLTPALSVARVAVRVAAFILATLTAMQLLGLPIAPILTTLGIGSLAVALALQDTLANFFAGLYLLADRPVRSGDYIKIRDGEEGFVEAIGWRSTRLRTLHDNIVIVPNQKLSQATLINCSLPEPHLAINVCIGVSYAADPEEVEAVLSEELLHAVGEIPELRGLPRAVPAVRLTGFGDSAVEFTCTVHLRDFTAQFQAAHHLRKRLLQRLTQEGIEIPFPQRVVHNAPPPDRRRAPRPDSGPRLG